MNETIWNSGKNNYLVHTLNAELHTYNTTLQDVETSNMNIHQLFNEELSVRQTKTVDILYSGGMDSECVLLSCLTNNIPVRAITMRLLVNNYPINTHDLYYSEKFCRERSVEHKLIDLHVDSFFSNGDHLPYLRPYLITEPHVATHFWLFEQCMGFPVMGGEYSWPQSGKKVLSPHRYEYSCYPRFLNDRGIHGIGNMLNSSLDINLLFIKNNLVTGREGYFSDFARIPMLKQKLFSNMRLGTFELRMKNYGWENISQVFNKMKYRIELIKEFGITQSSITWGQKIADALGGEPGTNNKY